MVLQNLKQSNKPAFNFAIASFVSLLFAVMGLIFLGQGLKEQKQIAKQVGDLQVVAQNIQNVVTAKSLLHGEAAAFLSLEKLVKDFNQQWRLFKQQHDDSDQKVKAVDVVWQRINANAQKNLSKKKEVIALGGIFQEMKYNFKLMHKINDELVNVLLPNNTDSRQVLMIKQLNVLLLYKERVMQGDYDGVERGYVTCDEGDRFLENMGDILNGFWIGDRDNYDIKKIEDKKARELVEQEIILHKKVQDQANTILENSSMLFETREAQFTIDRYSPELKGMLYKLNNHNLNKGLIVFTICAWLCVFACVYGYVRALQTEKTVEENP